MCVSAHGRSQGQKFETVIKCTNVLAGGRVRGHASGEKFFIFKALKHELFNLFELPEVCILQLVVDMMHTFFVYT